MAEDFHNALSKTRGEKKRLLEERGEEMAEICKDFNTSTTIASHDPFLPFEAQNQMGNKNLLLKAHLSHLATVLRQVFDSIDVDWKSSSFKDVMGNNWEQLLESQARESGMFRFSS
jgi:hypothetical protein